MVRGLGMHMFTSCTCSIRVKASLEIKTAFVKEQIGWVVVYAVVLSTVCTEMSR